MFPLGMLNAPGLPTEQVADILPFNRGPRPMNLEGGMARPQGGGGRVVPFRPFGFDWQAWGKDMGIPKGRITDAGIKNLRAGHGMSDNDIKLYYLQLLQSGQIGTGFTPPKE
jgi:hypothetical protein